MSELEEATQKEEWDKVALLLTRASEEKLSLDDLSKALGDAIESEAWQIVHIILKLKGDNKIPKTWVEITLQEVIKDKHWATAQFILAMEEDNKPSAQCIKNILENALQLGLWSLIQDILRMEGDNKPSIKLVHKCVLQAIEEGIELDFNPRIVNGPRELGHRLGLKGESFEGYNSFSAICSSRTRFKELINDVWGEGSSMPTLNLMLIEEASKKDVFSNFSSQTVVNYQSILCGWPNHGFTVTLFKERDNIHFIYVNRGSKTEELGGVKDENVMVYTLKNDAEGKDFLTGAGVIFDTQDRHQISIFFNLDEVKEKKNRELTAAFAKSSQKVGNCNIANSNMTWHFALADHYLKEHPEITLKDAFVATQPHYKAMRKRDRLAAFHQLFLLPNPLDVHDGIIHFFSKEKFLQVDYAKELFKSLTVEEVVVLKKIDIEGVSFWAEFVDVTRGDQLGDWDLIKKIISLMSPDESEMKYITWAFAEAIKGKKWDVVALIMNMKDLDIDKIKEGLTGEARSVLVARLEEEAAARAIIDRFKDALPRDPGEVGALGLGL